MDISMFLAQAFGLYLLIAGVALLMNPELVKELFKRFTGDSGDIAMGGFIILLLGIPLVLLHSIWDGTWHVVVSVLVWLMFLKGAVRVLAPRAVMTWTESLSKQEGVMRILLLVMVVLGLFLLYVGFNFG
jgi:hypothetical protein